MGKKLRKLPRGIRNKNPGNIRLSPITWKGEVLQNTDGSFEQFGTMQEGLAAMMKVIRTYMKKYGLVTICDIIGRWAPPEENDSTWYVQMVERLSGIDENAELTFSKDIILPIVDAMCFVENGRDYISNELLDEAWNLL